jgi:3-deoxy-7-phosphoheptulonate synthase
MIIIMKQGAKLKDIAIVAEKIKGLGYKPHISKGKDVTTIIGIIGDYVGKYKDVFESMGVVRHASEIQEPYKLASREFKKENTIVKVSRNIEIGGEKIHVIAGPAQLKPKNRCLPQQK